MAKKYVFSKRRNKIFTSFIDSIGGFLFFKVKKDAPLENIKNILVIRLDHIGDVVTTIPSLRALRKSFPDAKISVMVRSLTKELLVNCPYIDELIVYNPPWFRGKKNLNVFKNIQFFKKLRKKNFDLAIDFRGDIRNIALTYLCKSRYRLGYDVKGGDFLLTHVADYREDDIHIIERNLDVLKKIGIESKNKMLELWVPENIKKKVKFSRKKFVEIHPGSGGVRKLWNSRYFAKVADHIIEKHKAEVVITGSHDDVPLAKDIEKNMKFRCLNLAGKAGLLELSEIISRAKIFISPDSGPMHIAVAQGTPTISLFGTSVSDVWGYRSEKNTLLERKGDVKDIKPEEVIEAVDKFWRKK